MPPVSQLQSVATIVNMPVGLLAVLPFPQPTAAARTEKTRQPRRRIAAGARKFMFEQRARDVPRCAESGAGWRRSRRGARLRQGTAGRSEFRVACRPGLEGEGEEAEPSQAPSNRAGRVSLGSLRMSISTIFPPRTVKARTEKGFPSSLLTSPGAPYVAIGRSTGPEPGLLDGVLGFAQRAKHAIGDCPQTGAAAARTSLPASWALHRSRSFAVPGHGHERETRDRVPR